MGPRLNRRGKSGADLSNATLTRALQWGHASTGVERKTSQYEMLNRKQGFNGATPQQAWKVLSHTHQYSIPPCFNGATPQQAWKDERRRNELAALRRLQWGHASTGVESSP